MSGEVIFSLFEGACPDCGADAEIISAGGTAEFLDLHGDWGVEDFIEWEVIDNDGMNTIGSLEFECQNDDCGAKYCVEQTGAWGGYDWVM